MKTNKLILTAWGSDIKINSKNFIKVPQEIEFFV